MPNRLAAEVSPYLRQHADNPVDWYPWGPEALARARTEDKPILLSIGYAACHWCHVMAHESFEDARTAEVMNQHFVNIKVDREERPDIDAIYMQAVQAMTGHGGWPMTMFLTPEGAPFWGGTYFPPDDRMGMPSFRRVLASVADAYTSRRGDVDRTVETMRDLLATSARALPTAELSPDVFARAYDIAARTYDGEHGGFGGAPKFPPTMLLEFLLTHWARTGERRALTLAHDTYGAMAAGGVHDHVGGGFHRYAVDRKWLVPHFEKMLYDNALLARFGAHLWQATHDPAVRATTASLLTWVEREMTSPEGGFYASLDADSSGHEGLFYTWTPGELDTALGADARAFAEWFGVIEGGNFEGRSIPNRIGRDARDVRPAVVDSAIASLYDARARREWPARDDKIIAAWNGLMLRGIATCARVFGESAWHALALRNAEFLHAHLVRGGRVARIWARGAARGTGFLEDYAAVALGFLDVWQLTGDRAWFDRARALADATAAHFWDDDIAGFYDVPHDHELLLIRPRDVYDNAAPSGHSLAAELLLAVAYVSGDTRYAHLAERALASLAESQARHPHAFGNALCATDMLVHGATAVAIVGSREGATSLAAPLAQKFAPSLIVGVAAPGAHADLALFANRDARGEAAAAYVCRGPVCDAPALTAADVADRLDAIIAKSPRDSNS